MGIANANLMTMLVEDLNAKGGLLGRPIDLIVEDGETVDSVAKAARRIGISGCLPSSRAGA